MEDIEDKFHFCDDLSHMKFFWKCVCAPLTYLSFMFSIFVHFERKQKHTLNAESHEGFAWPAVSQWLVNQGSEVLTEAARNNMLLCFYSVLLFFMVTLL